MRPITGKMKASVKPNTRDGVFDQASVIEENFHPYQIAAEIAEIMNKPSPKTMLGKLFRKWHHHIDTDRINSLNAYLQTVIEYNNNVREAKFEMAVNEAVLEAMITGRKAELKYIAEKALADHEAYIENLEHEHKMKEKELEHKDAEIEDRKTKTYINKILGEAQAEAIKAETKMTRGRVKLLAKLVKEMNLEKITPSQAFVLAKALNPNDSADVDFAAREAMFQEELKKARAENRKREAEAKMEEHKAETTTGGDEEPLRGFADTRGKSKKG